MRFSSPDVLPIYPEVPNSNVIIHARASISARGFFGGVASACLRGERGRGEGGQESGLVVNATHTIRPVTLQSVWTCDCTPTRDGDTRQTAYQ